MAREQACSDAARGLSGGVPSPSSHRAGNLSDRRDAGGHRHGSVGRRERAFRRTRDRPVRTQENTGVTGARRKSIARSASSPARSRTRTSPSALGEDAPEEAEPTRTDPEVPEPEAAPETAEPEVEPEVEPERSFESFAELLTAARSELNMVNIGDVDDTACTLDAHAKARVWRTRTWNTLVMMQRFAEQRELGASTALRAWLENHPGPLILPDNVVPAETTLTASSPEFRRARTFRVPVEVDPDGSAYFGAHVRIEPGRTSPAPRLH